MFEYPVTATRNHEKIRTHPEKYQWLDNSQVDTNRKKEIFLRDEKTRRK